MTVFDGICKKGPHDGQRLRAQQPNFVIMEFNVPNLLDPPLDVVRKTGEYVWMDNGSFWLWIKEKT